jgi:hypothetical protein
MDRPSFSKNLPVETAEILELSIDILRNWVLIGNKTAYEYPENCEWKHL